jgi:hypothetical protein
VSTVVNEHGVDIGESNDSTDRTSNSTINNTLFGVRDQYGRRMRVAE